MENWEKHGWIRPGDTGKQCKLHLDELKVDFAYQRHEVSNLNTLAIARNFKWSAFGSIVVMERSNGSKYIVDGYQRVLAARRRGDIDLIPVVMFQSDGREHEAEAFVSLNVRRRPVGSVAKYNACVRAGLEPYLEISKWLSSVGMEVDVSGKLANKIDFPTAIVNLWEIDAEANKSAILCQKEVIGDEPMNSYIHRGLWWLAHNKIDIMDNAQKLRESGGKTVMLRSINSLKIETGRGGERTYGLGILAVINHKKKNKIRIKNSRDAEDVSAINAAG